MRVLMLSWEYPPHIVGGLGRHVAELLPELAARGIETHLVTPLVNGGPKREHDGTAIVHRVPLPAAASESFVSATQDANEYLARACDDLIAAEGRFDLIHNHDWLTAPAAVALKLRHKTPLVATIHATERGRGRGSLATADAERINDIEWRLTYESWRVICCTRFMADEISSYFGAPRDKLDIVPNGVDAASFSELDDVDLAEFRAHWARRDEKIVLFVGRMVHEKGAQVLVQAIPEVLAAEPNTRFVVAGKGPEAETIAHMITSLGLADRVALPGFISDEDRNKLYKVADCAVFPSLYEPFGIVALEAMAARVPVVVSEVGGLREVVRHAETGITVYPDDPASCAWGVLHTLQNPQWAQQRVMNAYREVLTVFNWATIAEQTENVYRRVVEERSLADW